ncbi:CHAT domain-containing protein [Actinocorallia aurea]
MQASHTLGWLHWYRYQTLPAQEDLETARTMFRLCLLAGVEDEHIPEALILDVGVDVAFEFAEHARATGDATLLTRSIDLWQRIINRTPDDHPALFLLLNNLGVALQTRFAWTGVQEDLELAIDVAGEAVRLTPENDPERSRHLNNLGSSLQLRFGRTGAQEDLEQAIITLREAVRATAEDSPDLAGHLNNLGLTLRSRFWLTGVREDLEQAITTLQEAVRQTTESSADRARHLNNLGLALRSRFERTGAQEDLERAVAVAWEAVRVTPENDPERARHLNNLGIALQIRFERAGVQEDIDQAIIMLGEAVRLVFENHPERYLYLNSLGIALHIRFERTGAREDIDQAIAALREAVRGIPEDHLDRVVCLGSLGNSLRLRFERAGAHEDLEQAIIALRETVRITPSDHPDRAGYLNNLGVALRKTGVESDLLQAAEALAEAAGVVSAAPSVRIWTAWMAGMWLARFDPGRAARLLESAVQMLPEVVPRELRRADQQSMIGDLAGMASDAASLALADTSIPVDERPANALRLLESGRAILIAQMLETRTDLTELRERFPELAVRLTYLRGLLDQPAAAPEEITPSFAARPDDLFVRHAADRRQVAVELAAILGQIRSLDGFSSFALPPTTDELLAQATHGPVVTFNVTRQRSDALLLTTDGITAIELPDLTFEQLADQINAFHQALTATTDRNADRVAAQERVRQVLGWLWDTATEPVLQALGLTGAPKPGMEWPRIWWAPGGLLGLLPLHAAGHHTSPSDPNHQAQTVLDRVVSSYTPTITALRHARRPTPLTADPGRALIVAMPTTPGLPRNGVLTNVEDEADLLATCLPNPVVLTQPSAPGTIQDTVGGHAPGGLPTRDAVFTHLAEATIAHFACHGYSDPADPSRSRLLLADWQETPLTIASLAPLDLDHAHLAYLSACSTALTLNQDLLDESIHLTSAFQLAGFTHVIGTLWPINDRIALDITETFYARLAHPGGTLDAGRSAQALHDTTRIMRDRLPLTPSLWAAHLHAGS